MNDEQWKRVEDAIAAARDFKAGRHAEGHSWVSDGEKFIVMAPTLRLCLLGFAHPLRGFGKVWVREDGFFECGECDGSGDKWIELADGSDRYETCDACGGDGKDTTRAKSSVL